MLASFVLLCPEIAAAAAFTAAAATPLQRPATFRMIVNCLLNNAMIVITAFIRYQQAHWPGECTHLPVMR